MNEIKCPKCGTVFQISEDNYNSIVKQVRDHEFEKELERNSQYYEKDKESAIKLARSTALEESNKVISEKDIRINSLEEALKSKEETTRLELDKKYTSEISKRDLEINRLSSEIKINEEKTKADISKEYNDKLNKKDLEIERLRSELEVIKTKSDLDLERKMSDKNREIERLTSEVELKDREYMLKEKTIKENFESKLKDRDEQISYYKDFKARQSTKMIGESLEQHCSIEFNRLRPLFKNAYFEKDNDARTGSKGDFIFKDFDDDGNEIVSIMFEMKNEADTTSTKHKNEDFFKELNKDRNEKKCEYAVLVSMLEIDNDYYNDGIVDVSHIYDKMYVIRPQFFIPLITLIRNLASKSLEYRKELELVRMQNIDITHFEENMNNFKDAFGRNYRLASERFKKAIEEIDKTIEHLQKTKENLLKTDDNLRLANNKAEALSIKKLTSGNETMKKKFEELKEEKEEV